MLLGVLAALHGNVSPRLVPLVDLLMHVLARCAGLVLRLC
jgi:hypothetical protein